MTKVFLPFLVVVVLFLSFIFYGASPQVSESQYLQIKEYNGVHCNASDTFSVMTYNIGYLSGMTNNRAVFRDVELYQTNLHRATQLVNDYRPDIIALQEIDFDSNRSYGINQMDSLAVACDYGNASLAVNWDKRYVPFPAWPFSTHFADILSGQAIMSHGEILEAQRIVLPKPLSKNLLYNAFYIDRLIQIAKVKLNGNYLYVLNVHLEAFDTPTREVQAKIVRSYYEKFASDNPVLLIGDFNAEPQDFKTTNDKTMSIILEGENIAHAYTPEDLLGAPAQHCTFSSENPTYKIDYILYNPDWIKPLDYKVLTNASSISDHLPVWMRFVVLKG